MKLGPNTAIVTAFVLAIAGSLCVRSSASRLSATHDEPNHLAAGLEWWQHGTYTLWTENPPLARVAASALPFMGGMRLPDRASWDPHRTPFIRPWFVGMEMLHGDRRPETYEANLAAARLGTLPFYLLSLFAVWSLAGGRARPFSALLALAFTASLPAVLGHAALGTTDVPFLAMFLLLVLATKRWLDHPSLGRSATTGLAFGAAVLTKFSALVFFPATVAALLVARRWLLGAARDAGWSRLAGQVALAMLLATLVVWAGYRFSYGPIDALPAEARGWFAILPGVAQRGPVTNWLLTTPLPAPEFFHGLLALEGHNRAGHTAYLAGQVSQSGFVWFYPLALAVKTPLTFMLLLGAALSAWIARRRAGIAAANDTERWFALGSAIAAVAIVAIASSGRLNLGIRHVLPALPLLAITAARLLGELSAPSGRAALLLKAGMVSTAAAQVLLAAVAWPNHLSYFNLFAGREPASMLLDSDLDWGQGLVQLRQEAARRGIDRLSLAYTGFSNPCALGLPRLEPLLPGVQTTGWIAISENYFRERSTLLLRRDLCDFNSLFPRGEIAAGPFRWLRSHQPVAIVAGSIRLYHVLPR